MLAKQMTLLLRHPGVKAPTFFLTKGRHPCGLDRAPHNKTQKPKYSQGKGGPMIKANPTATKYGKHICTSKVNSGCAVSPWVLGKPDFMLLCPCYASFLCRPQSFAPLAHGPLESPNTSDLRLFLGETLKAHLRGRGP